MQIGWMGVDEVVWGRWNEVDTLSCRILKAGFLRR